MSNVQAMGLSMAFKNATNARSYMEVLHRTPFSSRVQVLSLKSNHPDDAKLWLRDMQVWQNLMFVPKNTACWLLTHIHQQQLYVLHFGKAGLPITYCSWNSYMRTILYINHIWGAIQEE